MILQLLRKLRTTARKPLLPSICNRTRSIVAPAVAIPLVLSAMLASAQSFDGPLSTSKTPARDHLTQSFPRTPVSRYAPPVHIQPPPNPGENVPGPAVKGRAKNGRFNSTQNYSYKANPTVATLSDDSLAVPRRVERPAMRRESEFGASDDPGVRAAKAPQRRGGLQDRIASVLTRQKTNKSGYHDQEHSDNQVVSPPDAHTVLESIESFESRHENQVTTAETSIEEETYDNRIDRHVRPVGNESAVPAKRIRYPKDGNIELALDADVDEVIEVTQVAMAEPAARPSRAQSSGQQRRPKVSQYSRPVKHDTQLDAHPISVLSTRQDDSGANNLRSGNDEKFGGAFGGGGEIDLRRDNDIDDFDAFDSDEDMDDLDKSIDEELKRFRKNDRDEDDSDLRDDEADRSRPTQKSCEEFRYQLLGNSIRDIALDTSAPASGRGNSCNAFSRQWMDRYGNVIATGAMVDLRRGYVLLDSGEKIAYARLSEADWAAISDCWRLPTICSIGDRGSVARCWSPQTFTWTAANLCHKTLFFENIQLERYGHSHGPFSQPVVSVAHFFASLVTVPYQSAIHPANECQYALGYYRPGNCAPWLKDPIPISLAGASRQAFVTTGMSFIP